MWNASLQPHAKTILRNGDLKVVTDMVLVWSLELTECLNTVIHSEVVISSQNCEGWKIFLFSVTVRFIGRTTYSALKDMVHVKDPSHSPRRKIMWRLAFQNNILIYCTLQRLLGLLLFFANAFTLKSNSKSVHITSEWVSLQRNKVAYLNSGCICCCICWQQGIWQQMCAAFPSIRGS